MKIWIGSPSDVRQGEEALKALAKQNDSKFWDDEKGIIKVDAERWKAAQKFEFDGWSRNWAHATSDRNSEHEKGFNDYINVPQSLGNVIEIGCGQFTQLQTISKDRTINQVTLLDPLIEKYKQLPHCTYKNGRFQDRPTQLLCRQAELLHATEEFNTAICINVLEHVQDVEAVLTMLHRAIVPGGIVIFEERCYDGLNIDEIYDIGHPIRVKMKVFEDWEQQFIPLFNITPVLNNPLNQAHYFIGRKI